MLMDNNQMPTVQPSVPAPQSTVPTSQQVKAVGMKDNSGLIKTIVIIILSLIAVTFIGLFIWMFVRYDDASTDLNSKINAAVAEAEEEQAIKLEKEFAERGKDPYKTFSGPADYGQLTFKYPKTWSVYIASDAAKGGDFNAYFNPIEVNPVSNATVNALRLTIRDKDFESVASEYQRVMEGRDSNLNMESITVAGGAANRYSGTMPGTEFNGIVVIFKIRDKTAILQTDSILFEGDFNKLLETITFNV